MYIKYKYEIYFTHQKQKSSNKDRNDKITDDQNKRIAFVSGEMAETPKTRLNVENK